MPLAQKLSLRIVASQATIDDRHYAALYMGDDQYGNCHFRMYLNGKAVSSIVWNKKGERFERLQWTLHARNMNYDQGYVFPNELRKKLIRKLKGGGIYRMVKVR